MKFDYVTINSIFFLVTLLKHRASAQDDKISIIEDPECPCLREMTHVGNRRIRNDTCMEADVAPTSTSLKSVYCYPPSYGTECGAHNINLEPFCNDPNNQHQFCSSHFCFIDPAKCKFSKNNTYSQSTIFPNLFYSYTTCGAKDTWNQFRISNHLAGATIRVGVPAHHFPDHFKLDTAGNPIFNNDDINVGEGEFMGIYIDVLKEMALHGNFTVQYESVSSGNIEETGSRWTACAKDVGQGLLDMCVGNFWETIERRRATQFTAAVFNEIFYMRVPLPQQDTSLGVEIQKLFRPFNQTLWMTILLATIVVGFTYTALESDGKSPIGSIPSRIIGSVYTATMELLSGASDDEEQPVYRKSVTVTWAFFVLIVISAYTANLAAFLGKRKPKHTYSTVADCIANNCNLCYDKTNPVRNKLKELYPSLRRFQEFADDEIAEVPNALSNGTCDVYVESKYTWKVNPLYWGDCGTMWLGDTLFSFKVGWPVSLAVSESITYWLSWSLENGAFDEAMEKYEPIPRCVEPVNTDDGDEDTQQIGVKSMAGPLLILSVGIIFGVINKAWNESHAHVRKDPNNDRTEGDPVPLDVEMPVNVMMSKIESGRKSLFHY